MATITRLELRKITRSFGGDPTGRGTASAGRAPTPRVGNP